MTNQQILEKPQGLKFVQPLMFSNWPIDKIEELTTDIKSKYDLSEWELDYVDRGGYTKCKGSGSHEACDDLVETYGSIVWKRIK